MSVSYNHYVKNNLDVEGVITVANLIDTTNAGTMQIGQSTATKLEFGKTGVTTEMKGPAKVLEGLDVTGASTISTTLAVGQATPPSNDAIIEVVSTTKGILFPRMTTAQRTSIGSPSEGLVVYDTTEGALYYRSGDAWSMLVKNKVNNTNVIIGETSGNALSTGQNNTFLGSSSGQIIADGNQNTMIGNSTGGSESLNNQTALGYQATTTKANQVMIGNSSVVEMVPHASASVDLGTATNPWNNIYIKGNVVNTGGNGILTRTLVNSATYTLLSSDILIASLYSTTGAQTLTLPLSSSVSVGKYYHIVDTGGNASVNNITVDMSGSDTINGESNLLMNIDYQSTSIYNDGSGKWFVY